MRRSDAMCVQKGAVHMHLFTTLAFVMARRTAQSSRQKSRAVSSPVPRSTVPVPVMVSSPVSADRRGRWVTWIPSGGRPEGCPLKCSSIWAFSARRALEMLDWECHDPAMSG
jgi:hypothetical protein